MNFYIWIVVLTVAIGSAWMLFAHFREVNISAAEARKKLIVIAIEVAILTALLMALSFVVARYFPSSDHFSFSRALGIAFFTWLLTQAMARYIRPKIRALMR